MISPETVTLSPNSDPFKAFISAFEEAINLSDLPLESRLGIGKQALSLIESGGAVQLEAEATSPAGKLLIRLEPSKALLDLLATLRTGN